MTLTRSAASTPSNLEGICTCSRPHYTCGDSAYRDAHTASMQTWINMQSIPDLRQMLGHLQLTILPCAFPALNDWRCCRPSSGKARAKAFYNPHSRLVQVREQQSLRTLASHVYAVMPSNPPFFYTMIASDNHCRLVPGLGPYKALFSRFSFRPGPSSRRQLNLSRS